MIFLGLDSFQLGGKVLYLRIIINGKEITYE